MFHTVADETPVGASDLQVQHWDALQYMDGFGAADRNSLQLSDAQADFFFGTSDGQLGLSILRTPIFDDGTGTYDTNHQKAAARGARIWAAPWSAPAAWKTSGSLAGGHLLTANYGDWGDRMAGFYDTLQAEGVTLDAISVQGEPNWTGTHPTMVYTAAELRDFLKVLGPKVAAKSSAIRIILPETTGGTGTGNSDGSDCQGYIDAVLADATAAAYFHLAAQHQYNGVALRATNGRRMWMSEMSSFDAFDASITHGLTVAGWIHEALTTARCSAWHYWEIIGGPQSDNESLVGHDSGTQATKRSYVLGQWARFIRPGWNRVTITGTITNVSVTAFKEIGTGKIAIVCINATAGALSGTVGIYGLTLTALTPYRTSSSEDMVAQTVVPVTRGVFTASLPASSVTTFYGTGTGG